MTKKKEVAVFDPNKVMDNIKAKVKEQFLNIIPDEQWEEFIKKEYKDFFMTKKEYYRSNHNQKVTGFGVIVRDVINEMAKEKVKEYFSDKQFNHMWSTEVMDEKMKEYLANSANTIVASFFSNIASNAIANYQNNAYTY